MNFLLKISAVFVKMPKWSVSLLGCLMAILIGAPFVIGVFNMLSSINIPDLDVVLKGDNAIMHHLGDDRKNALILLAKDEDGSIMGNSMHPAVVYRRVRLSTITQYFNVYIVSFENFSQLQDIHMSAVSYFQDDIDFLFISAHGNPESIMLSPGRPNLTGNMLAFSGVNLSHFYSKNARILMSSCSVANSNVANNFAQALANVINRPVEGSEIDNTWSVSYYFHLEDTQKESVWDRLKYAPRDFGSQLTWLLNCYGLNIGLDKRFEPNDDYLKVRDKNARMVYPINI